jgi:hypothetical protein
LAWTNAVVVITFWLMPHKDRQMTRDITNKTEQHAHGTEGIKPQAVDWAAPAQNTPNSDGKKAACFTAAAVAATALLHHVAFASCQQGAAGAQTKRSTSTNQQSSKHSCEHKVLHKPLAIQLAC